MAFLALISGGAVGQRRLTSVEAFSTVCYESHTITREDPHYPLGSFGGIKEILSGRFGGISYSLRER